MGREVNVSGRRIGRREVLSYAAIGLAAVLGCKVVEAQPAPKQGIQLVAARAELPDVVNSLLRALAHKQGTLKYYSDGTSAYLLEFEKGEHGLDYSFRAIKPSGKAFGPGQQLVRESGKGLIGDFALAERTETLYAIWSEIGRRSDTDVAVLYNCRDKKGEWGKESLVATLPDLGNPKISMAIDEKGNAHILYQDKDGLYCRSTKEGVLQRPRKIAGAAKAFDITAKDAQLAITWLEHKEKSIDVYVQRMDEEKPEKVYTEVIAGTGTVLSSEPTFSLHTLLREGTVHIALQQTSYKKGKPRITIPEREPYDQSDKLTYIAAGKGKQSSTPIWNVTGTTETPIGLGMVPIFPIRTLYSDGSNLYIIDNCAIRGIPKPSGIYWYKTAEGWQESKVSVARPGQPASTQQILQ